VTYRIHRSMRPGANVFVLSGVLDTEHAARLRELLAGAADSHVVLDLKDVTLVDRAAVQFLGRVEMDGTEIVNCPEYVRSRIAADRDGELAESLRHHESSAAERLVTTYQSRAYRLAASITGNAEDAEEVVQDAFWTVIRKIDTFRGESALGSWLYRIVANAAYGKLRHRRGRRMEIPLDDVLPAFDEDGRHAAPVVDWSARVDDSSRRTELRLAVSSALEALPAHYRAALVLRDVEGWSCAEVADALSLSVTNVKARVHRARLFIRKRLTESMSVAEFSRALCQLA
jgi:RNA polymerase sigma-70 factor (ECF subfamily)